MKQADLVLAMHLRGDAFTAEQKVRNFAYYEALTVRDSSLSACTQAVMAAEVGHLDLAYDYLGEAALDGPATTSHHNTRDGLHMASLAGAWTALVAGFGGMRAQRRPAPSRPGCPAGLTRLAFRVSYRGRHRWCGPTAGPRPTGSGRRAAGGPPPRGDPRGDRRAGEAAHRAAPAPAPTPPAPGPGARTPRPGLSDLAAYAAECRRERRQITSVR